jgi:pSer/pThr/pTyr-binding forkhead associated (FHA) protein
VDAVALDTLFAVNTQKTLSAWKHPILLIRSSKRHPHSRSVFDTPDPRLSSQDTSQSSDEQSSLDYYLDPEALVVLVSKTTRNAFTHMVTIGRASDNDIVVADKTLSKVHGWFLPPSQASGDKESWCYVDNNSTNGTKINKHQILPQRPAHLNYGDEFVMGDLRLLFLSKENILDLVDYMQNENGKTRRVSR